MLCVIGLAIAVTYARTATERGFFPEDPLFFHKVANRNLREVLSEYGNFNDTYQWYRPTTFYLTYWLLTQVIDWHDVVAFRLVNLATFLFLNGLLFFVFRHWLSRSALFRPSRPGQAALLAVTLFSLSPIHLAPLFHTTAFDFLHQVFLWASVALYVEFIVPSRPRKRQWPLLAGAVATNLLAITSKETAIVLPALVGMVAWGLGAARSPRLVVTLLLAALPSIGLLGRYLLVIGFFDGGEYRTVARSAVIRSNLLNYWDWSLRLFYQKGSYLPGLRAPLHHAAGLLLLAGTLLAFFRCRRKPGFNRFQVWLLLLSIAALLLPAYSGGFPWHFSVPSAFLYLGLAVAWETAFAEWLPERARPLPLFAVVLWCAWQTNTTFERFLDHGPFTESYRINLEARQSPPIPPDRVGPSSRIIIRNASGRSRWDWGCGFLFSYVYKRPGLSQLLLNEIPENRREAELARPGTFCVDWDPQAHRWRELGRDCLERVGEKREEHPAQKAG